VENEFTPPAQIGSTVHTAAAPGDGPVRAAQHREDIMEKGTLKLIVIAGAGIWLAGCESTAAPMAAETVEPAASAAPSGGPSYRHQVNGEYASSSGYSMDDGMSTYWYVQASRNGRDAFATVSIDRCTYDPMRGYVCQWIYGFGRIHAADLSGNLKGMTLRTDTRTNPDFHIYGGEGGVIDVRWTPDGFSGFRTSGSTEQRWMHTTVRTGGDRREESAAATGSVFGLELGGGAWSWGMGHMGTARNLTMWFERDAR
jgi:hypothetical protein